MDEESQATDGKKTGKRFARWKRPVFVLVFLASLFALGKWSGLYEELTLQGVRDQVLAAGPWGALVLTALFVVSLLLQVPGMIFVAACLLIYGPIQGAALSCGSGVLALTVSFFVVRRIGGQPLGEIRFKWARRALGHLEDRPLMTIALLRLVLHFSPVVNYALALSGIRFRDYIVGSIIGLTPVILISALLVDRLEGWFA